MSAARDGDLAALNPHPELVNVRHDGATALHFAAINGRLEAVRWLLEQGATLDAGRMGQREGAARDGRWCIRLASGDKSEFWNG